MICLWTKNVIVPHFFRHVSLSGLHRIIFALLLLGTGSVLCADELIADPALREVLLEIVKRRQPEKKALEQGDLNSFYVLDARNRKIKDLKGIELCRNLVELELSDNLIQGVAPLETLTNLQSLSLAHNQIVDAKPLAALKKLQYLDLDRNKVDGISGYEALTNLRTLSLGMNKIADIGPLAQLTKLTSLDLTNNLVEDISPLKSLTSLSTLSLKGNKIKDLAPLADCNQLHYLFLEGNPLTDVNVLVEMAKKDIAGPMRFAPYWFVYIDVDKAPKAVKQQVDDLKKTGVRINVK